MRASGKTYNQGSEHKWAEWQVPPVICPGCLKRVTLKQAFYADFVKGTFHDACAPYRVESASN